MITVVVKFIRRYCPVMIGDKNAFNHWAKILRLKIKF